MSISCCKVQSSVAIRRSFLSFDVFLQKKFEQVEVAALSCEVKGRAAVKANIVDVSKSLQEYRHDSREAVPCRHVKARVAVGFSLAYVTSGPKQLVDRIRVTEATGDAQRTCSASVASADVKAVENELLNDVNMSPSTSHIHASRRRINERKLLSPPQTSLQRAKPNRQTCCRA